MLTPYTTTLTDEAQRRGIRVTLINPDPDLPIFELSRGGKSVRCFNALTDLVGAATYHLLNNKRACHAWLASRRIPVPAQLAYDEARPEDALAFLRDHAPIVVKPCMQWGGRGVSMGVRTPHDLHAAVRFARQFEPDVIFEETVPGEDLRVILTGGELAAAIRRTPAAVTGDGLRTLRQLIVSRNAHRRREDPSNVIPWNAETRRNLAELGRSPSDIPAPGERVRVRLTNNYHTGGTCDIVTDAVPARALKIAQRIACELSLPLVGVDFLHDRASRRLTVIEVSPDMAISPPEGATVAKRFLDHLFPSQHSTPDEKRRLREHLVTHALLRIENAIGIPPHPFERPSPDADFWVLELCYKSESLEKWQSRAEPILQSHFKNVRKWVKSGSKCFLHVQTSHPVPMYPAVFSPTFLSVLSKLNCTLETRNEDPALPSTFNCNR